MGAKLSSSSNHRGSLPHPQQQALPARVIAADGSLKELPATASPRAAVSDVLASEPASSFVCNSDALYFNEPPPALPADEPLRPGQIYFVLPLEALARPLSTADMASLAVRATAALAVARAPRRRGAKNAKKVRVVPLQDQDQEELQQDGLFNEKLNERTLGEFAAATGPAKKTHGKLAARSRLRLKRALSIIQEMAD